MPEKTAENGDKRKPEQQPILTVQQQKLITAMLTHPTIVAAAQSIKISERTARTYLAMPHVQRELAQAKQQLLRDTLELLQLESARSVQTIVEIRDDPEAPYNVRLKAAELLKAHLPAPADDDATAIGISADILRWLELEEVIVLESLFKKAEERKRLHEQAQGIIPIPIRGSKV